MSFLPEHLFHKSSKNILWVKSNCFYSPWKWMMCCENEKEFPRGMKQKGMNLAKDKHKGSTWLCLLCSDPVGLHHIGGFTHSSWLLSLREKLPVPVPWQSLLFSTGTFDFKLI